MHVQGNILDRPLRVGISPIRPHAKPTAGVDVKPPFAQATQRVAKLPCILGSQLPDSPLFRRYVGGGAGVMPWRRMISAILARSGGPPGVALITSAVSRKYCGPIMAGRAPSLPEFRRFRTGEWRLVECTVLAPVQHQIVFRPQSRSALRRCHRSSPRNGRGYALEPPDAARPGQRVQRPRRCRSSSLRCTRSDRKAKWSRTRL